MTTQIARSDAVVPEVMMDAQEARACVEGIRGHLEGMRRLVLDLYQREGWRALGYASWRECVVAEFDQSQSYLYRQLQAALIETEISPIGEIGTMPESHARELAKAPEGERAEVYEEAVETAPDGKLTAAHIAAAAQEHVAKGTWVWWEDERSGLRIGRILGPYASGYMIRPTIGPDACLPRESFTIGTAPDNRLCARCQQPVGSPSHLESDGWVCTMCFQKARAAKALPAPAPSAPTLTEPEDEETDPAAEAEWDRIQEQLALVEDGVHAVREEAFEYVAAPAVVAQLLRILAAGGYVRWEDVAEVGVLKGEGDDEQAEAVVADDQERS